MTAPTASVETIARLRGPPGAQLRGLADILAWHGLGDAAVTADLLAKQASFFSIGTNDLIQYTLAIDRGNDRIAHLYEPTHPAIIRTLRHIVTEAHRAKVTVSVCGEMAGDPVFTSLLLGLGVDVLSMSPAWLPSVKYLIRAMAMSDARALAEEALALGSAPEIYARCEAFYRARVRID